MRQCFTRKCGLVVLFMLFAVVQGVWAQTVPTINFSPNSANSKSYDEASKQYTVLISERNFKKPNVTLTSDERNLRRYYTLRYSLDQSSSNIEESLDNDGHKIYKDKTTGTSVNNFTGDVTIGSLPTGSGSPVKIKVTATPSSLYADQYEAGSADYSIVIKSPEVSDFTVSFPGISNDASDKSKSVEKALGLITSSYTQYGTEKFISSAAYINVKGMKLTYLASSGDYSIDVTKDFTISFSDASEQKALTLTDVGQKAGDSIKVESTYKGNQKESVEQDILVTLTPKNTNIYGNITLKYTIRVNTSYYPGYGKDKIKTYITFPNREEKWYHYPNPQDHGNYQVQKPKIVDEFGNDVTQYYERYEVSWTARPLNSFRFSFNPWDKGSNFKDEKGNQVEHNPRTDYTLNDNSTQTMWGGLLNCNYTFYRPDDYVITCKVKKPESYNPNEFAAAVLADEVSILGPDGSDKYDVINGQLYYSSEGADTAHVYPGQYVVHVHKRAPELVITPNPNDIKVAQNYQINRNNHFGMMGYFYDDVLNYRDSVAPNAIVGNYPTLDGFEYSFFVPDELASDNPNHDTSAPVTIEVTNLKGVKLYDYNDKKINNDYSGFVFPGITLYLQKYDNNGKPILDDNKQPVMEKKTGTIYRAKYGFNYEGDDIQVTFHGIGDVPLYYNVETWNPTRWDISDYQTAVYHTVDKQPVKLIVNPKEFVIHIGDVANPPSAMVWDDQFQQDVTDFYDLSWNKETTDNIIEFNSSDHTSTGKEIGTSNIVISAKKKSEQDLDQYKSLSYPPSIYSDEVQNSPDKYKVRVINNRILYDVIYDKDYYKYDEGSTTPKKDGNNKPIPDEYEKTFITKMGKLHFVDNGDVTQPIDGTGIDFTPGQDATNMAPGLNIQFGSSSDVDNKWKVFNAALRKNSDHTTSTDALFDDYSLTPNAANEKVIDVIAGPVMFASSESETNVDNMTSTFGEDGKYTPVIGGFLKLMPTTNGFLQIDANFGTKENPVTYSLVDANADDPIKECDHAVRLSTAEGSYFGERSFQFALLDGHTYYLFCDGGSFHIHGLTFMPAFVVMHEDKEPAKSATVFANSPWIGDLATLVNENKTTKDGATPAVGDVNFTETFTEQPDGTWPTSIGIKQLDNTTKNVEASTLVTVQNGYQIKGLGFTFKNRVRVRGSVIGKSELFKNNTVERAPYIDIASAGIPIYKVANTHEGVAPGTRVTTTNFVTRMWMTWGGWEHDDNDTYPYGRINKGSYEEFVDGWNNAKSDTVGRDNMTIDGFKYASGADQNAYDENVKLFNPYGVRGYFSAKDMPNTQGANGGSKFKYLHADPFNVPVRGGYVKFEPGESGTLMVYVLQNGMTDLDNNHPTEHLSGSPEQIRRRSLYIIDEHAKTVNVSDVNDDWTAAESFGLSEGPNHSPYLNYMTEGLLRCTWTGNPTGKELTFVDSRWADEYPKGNADPDYQADKEAIEKAWKNKEMNSLLDVVKLKDGSFVVPTKAYVRYTFDVKAGKTYYVFMNGSKLQVCGFAFVPAGFMANAASWPTTENETGLTAKDSVARAALPEPSEVKFYTQTDGTAGHKTINLTEKEVEQGSTANHDPDAGETNHASASDGVDKLNINFVNVTLDRSFKNNEWTSICLPFSVNQTQMKEIFGNDAMLITFDSVMTSHVDSVRREANGTISLDTIHVSERTVHFTRHVTQDLIAGKPYFLMPRWTDAQLAALSDNEKYSEDDKTVGRKNITFKHVSFEAQPAKTDTCWNYDVWYHNDLVDASNMTDDKKKAAKKDIFTYRFTGIYDRQQIPWYSYVMGTTTKDGNVQNGLYRITSTQGVENPGEKPYLKGFRAYLYPWSADVNGEKRFNDDGELAVTDGTSSAKADITNFWITGGEVVGDSGNGTTTDIEQLVQEMNTMLTEGHKGVYNLQGMLVRHDNDLSGLPAGVYIMNGKKYLIK